MAVHPSHPFARRSSVAVAELDGEPFVAFDPDLSIRRAIDRFLRHMSSGRSRARVRQHREHQACRRDSLGDPSFPSHHWRGKSRPGPWSRSRSSATTPATDSTRPLAIIHRRQASLEPAAAKFLELLIGEDVIDGSTDAASAMPTSASRRRPSGCATPTRSLYRQIADPAQSDRTDQRHVRSAVASVRNSG